MSSRSKLDRFKRMAQVHAGLTALVILLTGACLFLAGGFANGYLQTALRAAGEFIMLSVAVAFLYDALLRQRHEDQLRLLITDSLIPGSVKWGLVAVVDKLDFAELFTNLERGDRLLWLDTWCPEFVPFHTVRAAVERGAHVQMLVIDPDSEVAHFRAVEATGAGYDSVAFKANVRRWLENLDECAERLSAEPQPGSIEVRRYSDLPCVPMYITIRSDGSFEAFTAYFLQEPSHRSPHLHWEARVARVGEMESFVARFRSYFEGKWDLSQASSKAESSRN